MTMLDPSHSATAIEPDFLPSRLALSTIISVPGGDDGSTGGSGGSSVKEIATDELASALQRQEDGTDSAESTKDISFEESQKPTATKADDVKPDVSQGFRDATMVKPAHVQSPSQSSSAKLEFEFPTAAGPRSCSFGGGLCELMVVEAIQEFLTYHGMDESLHSLNKEVGAHGVRSVALVANSGNAGCAGEEYWGSATGCSLVGCELSVGHALACFDGGRKEKLFEVWEMLVPTAAAKSPVGCALGIRLRVHFGVYATRRALKLLPVPRCLSAESEGAGAGKAMEPESKSVPEPDFEDLKAFLALNPSANLDQSAESLAPLFALPFVPQPHTRPGFKFIFEDTWVHKLRMDLHAFLLAHATARRAPMLRHLAGALVMAKGPKTAPPPASWHELVRLADLGLASAARVRGGQGSAGGARGAGARAGANFFKDQVNARCRLAAVAAKPDVPPPVPMSAQQQVRALGTAAREICDSSPTRFWSQRAGSAPCLDDAIFSDISRRDLVMSPSRRPPSKRLQSARNLESRARTATAVLPMPPALDFARIAATVAGKSELGSVQGQSLAGQEGSAAEEEASPRLDSLLRALLRRIALPDEPVRPRRTFLAAFACFGALRALVERLSEIVNTGDLALTELALAILAVCACEAVGRKEIEQAEMGNARCIATLVEVLERKSMAGPVHIQCLAVLQRLSLRRRLQSRMIAEGAIDWILQALRSICNPSLADTNSESMWNLGPGGDEPGAPDFMLEFASALLMNLMLRDAGRRRCVELDAYDVLVNFIEHPNSQVRTHVNGSLYNLMGVPAFREVARSKHAEASFRAALNRVPPGDELLRRQLEYLLVQLASSGSNEADENSDVDVEQGFVVDADDGDNFLDEEELAGHFLLVSSAACAANAEDAAASVAGAGGNMAVERTAAEAAAVSQAASAQAAAAEEALRRFRVSPLIADAQQRLFHAFIANSCGGPSGGLHSPSRNRRNRLHIDSAGSPITNGAAAILTPSPPPVLSTALEEDSPSSPAEIKEPAAAPSAASELAPAPAAASASSPDAHNELAKDTSDQVKDSSASNTKGPDSAIGSNAKGPDSAKGGKTEDAKPISKPNHPPAAPTVAEPKACSSAAGSRRNTPGAAGAKQRGTTPSSSRGSNFGAGNQRNKRSSSQASGRVASGGGRAASNSSSQGFNTGGTGGSNGSANSDRNRGHGSAAGDCNKGNGSANSNRNRMNGSANSEPSRGRSSTNSDQNKGAGPGNRANQRARTSSPRPTPSLPPLVGPSSKSAPNGENSEQRNRSAHSRSTDGKAVPSKTEVAKAASTTADAAVRAGIGQRMRSKPTNGPNSAAALASKPLRTSKSTPHLPPLIAERRST